jgi:LruC domain-containing protein
MDQFSIVPFSSKDNLVWGLMLPVDFQYPKEFTNVREAYPGFTEWAKSSGSTNTDWYNTPETDKIYTFSEN